MDKTSIDLLSLTGRDTVLKKVANTRGGEFAGACPFCGGVDRFHVQPNYGTGYFFCRQCDAKGDAIAYVMRRDNVKFRQAVEILGLPLDSQPSRPAPRTPRRPENAPNTLNECIALDDDGWQNAANSFCERAFNTLWSAEGKKALAWLKNRGISESVIEAYGLGFNTEDTKTTWGNTEVFIDRGVVIPWLIDGRFWRINIRRAEGKPKYRGVKGGANGLYNADAITRDDIVIMVEGEFDALVIASHVKGVTPVATGAMSWARVLRWTSLVSTSRLALLAFDVDENGAGDKAAAWWHEQLGDKAIRLLPTEHDVTDMYKAGHDLQAWVEPYSLWCDYELTDDMVARRRDERGAMMNDGWRLAEVI